MAAYLVELKMTIYSVTCNFNSESDENDAQCIIFMNSIHTFLRRNPDSTLWIDLPDLLENSDKRKIGHKIVVYAHDMNILNELFFSGKINTMRKANIFHKSDIQSHHIDDAICYVQIKKAHTNNAKYNVVKYIEYSHIKNGSLAIYALKIFRRTSNKRLEHKQYTCSTYGFNYDYFPIFA